MHPNGYGDERERTKLCKTTSDGSDQREKRGWYGNMSPSRALPTLDGGWLEASLITLDSLH